jgi:hypothetical protein
MRCDFADDKKRRDREGESNEVSQAEGTKIQASPSPSLSAEARDKTDWQQWISR